ncbi:MAG: aminotransferase class I/II-fold pyridoxal phosphate-dependent enzyme [Candidatus Lokiarchaeota archaeon]|nr:aminotransferase class I/II-fold pyridoxal phosphate-dependent enzyme [Candidatus Lokiarchaeota archaeon]
MELSSRVKHTKHSATLAINEFAKNLRAKGETLLHMGFGESPFPVNQSVREALCNNADQKSYLSSQGILPLRKQISTFYRVMFNLEYLPEQIVVGPGSKTLIYAALLSLEGPLLLPAPSWVSYQHQAKLVGKETFSLKTMYEDSYRLQVRTLERKLSEMDYSRDQQKILLLNYPNNPTGHEYSAADLKTLTTVAQENNIIVISDEIYGLISYGDNVHQSIAKYYPEGTIVTGGMAKDRSLGGYRMGVMLVPESEETLVDAISSIASETWSCVAAPVQYAAIEGYSTASTMVNYIKDCASIHEIMTKYVHNRLDSADIRCPAPEGAFYLLPDWNKHRASLQERGVSTSKELAQFFLKNLGVVSLPGSEFGMPEQDLCLRLASVDYDGASALENFLNSKDRIHKNHQEFIMTVAPRVVAACDRITSFTESLD